LDKRFITRGEFHANVMQICGRSSSEPIDRPEDAITRIETAVLLKSALPPMNTGFAGGLKPPFKDLAALTAEQQAAAALVYHLGLMAESEAGLFEPHRKLNVEEAKWMLCRIQERKQSRKRPVVYEVVNDPETLPPFAPDRTSEMTSEPGLTVRSSEDATYVIISAGERKTGGYRIEPKSIVQGDGRIEILIELIRPAPGMMLLQAITCPQLILRLPKTGQPILLLNPDALLS
jgi:hypothetical protein